MTGYIDLHCHVVPGVDDGVRTSEEGFALCGALAGMGYSRLVATPHIRTAMFENRRSSLVAPFGAFRRDFYAQDAMPTLGLAAEHYFDDQFWTLFEAEETILYPGGRAILLELNPNVAPMGFEARCFELLVRGIRPVMAHPERYQFLFDDDTWVREVQARGVLLQLDLMSLAGTYGKRPKHLAERWLGADLYSIACTDCHRLEQIDDVAKGIKELFRRLGAAKAAQLLKDGPQKVLDGTIMPV
ncbi:MAG: protein tyrosine phosphatase [Myxococcales bacterium]|nr:protein tyrosine phosphatase [Myxococcales bacterium]MCB9708573.1 protein tyrosine phosphatase [Myxococcales bacterium]